MSEGDGETTPRRGSPSPKLPEEEFKRRFRSQFIDPAFDPLSDSLDEIAEAAWDAYRNSRKSPHMEKAGAGYHDPDYELATDWIRARAAIDESVQYAKDRKQFDKPIAEFQAVQWKLADMATELDAAHLLAMRAAYLKENKRLFSREAAMAKVFASEAANRICNEAVQIHGGYGYIREFPAERHLRDVRVTTIYEGTSEVQRIVIARSQLA